jgi:hypothetical protein
MSTEGSSIVATPRVGTDVAHGAVQSTIRAHDPRSQSGQWSHGAGPPDMDWLEPIVGADTAANTGIPVAKAAKHPISAARMRKGLISSNMAYPDRFGQSRGGNGIA